MEYSVLDLVKQLLKKWYIILLATIVAAAAAVVLSQYSYQKAVEDYNVHTGETLPLSSGIGQATRHVQIKIPRKTLNQLREILEEMKMGYIALTDEQLEDLLVRSLKSQVIEKLKDDNVLLAVQEYMQQNEFDEDFLLREHFDVQDTEDGTIQLVTKDLTEPQSILLLDTYIKKLEEHLSGLLLRIEFKKIDQTFTLPNPKFTEDAQFAQTVMQEPGEKPSMVKAALTGGIFGVVFGSLGVLCWIFVKDMSKKSHDYES